MLIDGRTEQVCQSTIIANTLRIHRGDEFVVGGRTLHVAHQEQEGFFRLHVGQVIAEDEHALEHFAVEQEVVAAGA